MELVASKGPWIVTRSEGEDTEIRVHSYEGDLLAVLDTKQIRNFQLSVSDDGCLFGCAAWSPGVKIYNVKEKGGNFQKVEKALDVPTSSGSIAFCISPDQRRAAVLNKNNNLSTWRLDVRHQAGEDTKMVAEKDVHLSDQGATTLHYSRDGSVIIAACGCSLYLFNAEDLQLIRKGLRPAILRLPLGK
ncbi:Transducin (Beta)-like 2, related [Eimeria acervulina]|uniref:Transducin (Beta)-like 2, related n=1 Tax=Eimeria acervulina TaxID=5801 RepID=U6GXJ7_EIMAC|nr:Transducin (Beta)-like 2, related [Eimeria acervulina]CDI84327.1 Transducin (Beta)-like 2, related [Eimeria acervulina]